MRKARGCRTVGHRNHTAVAAYCRVAAPRLTRAGAQRVCTGNTPRRQGRRWYARLRTPPLHRARRASARHRRPRRGTPAVVVIPRAPQPSFDAPARCTGGWARFRSAPSSRPAVPASTRRPTRILATRRTLPGRSPRGGLSHHSGRQPDVAGARGTRAAPFLRHAPVRERRLCLQLVPPAGVRLRRRTEHLVR